MYEKGYAERSKTNHQLFSFQTKRAYEQYLVTANDSTISMQVDETIKNMSSHFTQTLLLPLTKLFDAGTVFGFTHHGESVPRIYQ